MAASDSLNYRVYEKAKEGDMAEVLDLLSRGADINMVIMGGADGKQKEVCQYALEHGACLLWAIQQPPRNARVHLLKYDKPISMLKGPGEVPKGTFKQTTKD